MTILRMGLVSLLLLSASGSARGEEPAAIDPAAPESGAVRAPVEALYATLLGVMENAGELGFEGRYSELAPVVASNYDLGFMGSRVLGRRFNALTPEQQQAWLDTFERLTVSTYADRFDGFSGQSFEIGESEPSAAGTWIVRTRLIDPGEEAVAIDYRLRNGGEGWRIVDVYLSGTVSELALRRSEYSSVLKNEGFEALEAAVKSKIAEAEAGTSDEGS